MKMIPELFDFGGPRGCLRAVALAVVSTIVAIAAAVVVSALLRTLGVDEKTAGAAVIFTLFAVWGGTIGALWFVRWRRYHQVRGPLCRAWRRESPVGQRNFPEGPPDAPA
jgi:hypothetical protein